MREKEHARIVALMRKRDRAERGEGPPLRAAERRWLRKRINKAFEEYVLERALHARATLSQTDGDPS